MDIKDEIEIKYETTLMSVEEYVPESILDENGSSENAVFGIENSNSWNNCFVDAEDVEIDDDPLDLEEMNYEDQDKSNEELSQIRNMINFETLIKMVSKRKPLWDVQKKCSLRDRNRHWEAIAAELGSTAKVVKMRWKKIRYKHWCESKKLTKSGFQSSEWPLYKQLRFLNRPVQYKKREAKTRRIKISRDITKTSINRKSKQNNGLKVLLPSISTRSGVLDNNGPSVLPPSISTRSSVPDNNGPSVLPPSISTRSSVLENNGPSVLPPSISTRSSVPDNNGTSNLSSSISTRSSVPQPSISTNQTVFKAPLKKKIKLSPDLGEEMRTLEEQFLEIEKEKLKHFEESSRRNNDCDYQFLVSLLPFLRDIPHERKLLVRAKLQQVFVEELLYKTQQHVPYYTTYPSPSSSSNGIRLLGQHESRKDSTAPSPQSHSSSESI